MFGLMKIKTFAEEMGVPKSTVYSWKDRGDIPPSCFKPIGGTWFVRVKEMKEWIDKTS
jgi:predicted site-specific integrase-resolvase